MGNRATPIIAACHEALCDREWLRVVRVSKSVPGGLTYFYGKIYYLEFELFPRNNVESEVMFVLSN